MNVKIRKKVTNWCQAQLSNEMENCSGTSMQLGERDPTKCFKHIETIPKPKQENEIQQF